MSHDTEDAVYAALVKLNFDDYTIYDYKVSALENYVYHHLAPGSFLTAVLTGEPKDVCLEYADVWNTKTIDDILRFVNEQLPPGVHGSPQAYIDWVWRR